MLSQRRSPSEALFYFCLAGSLVMHAVVGTERYYALAFTSDGFHYYSAIRNCARGFGPWEGPVFQYLLGNHAYLTLFGLAPLVKLFASPLVLFYVGLGAWHLSALIVFLVGRHLANQFASSSRSTPALVGLAYLGYPVVVEGASGFGIYLFQPDSLLAPGLALLTYAYLKRERILFLLAMVFVLWTKEEYLPLVPIVAVWLMVTSRYLYRQDCFGVKDWIIAAGVYAPAAAFSVVTFIHFRGENTALHVRPSLDLLPLAWPKAYLLAAFVFASLVLPILPFAWAWLRGTRLAVVPSVTRRWTVLYVTGTVVVFVVARLLADMLIYRAVIGVHAWSHTVIATMLFLMLAVVFAPGLEGKAGRGAVDLKWPVLVSLGLSLAVSAFWMTGGLDRVSSRKRFPVFVDELAEIRKHVPQAERYEAILIPEHHMASFMDRSHGAYEWWRSRPAPHKATVTPEFHYVVLPKGVRTNDDLSHLRGTHRRVLETKHYLLLKRNWD